MQALNHTLLVQVTDTAPVATDALKITLRALHDQPVHYQAGQYLTFLISKNGKEFRRSYSLITTPGVDLEMAIVIKRQPNGEVSRYLFDHVKTGDVFTSLHPAGRFTLLSNAAQPQTIFFLAAGSGISPVYALVKDVLYHHPFIHIILVYQNRNEAGTIFRDELRLLQQTFSKRFVLLQLFSEPAGTGSLPQRLNNNLLEQLIGAQVFNMSNTVFYICGPESFMRMSSFVLKYMGFSDTQIRRENFVVNFIPPVPLLTDTSPKTVTLRWQERVFQFSVRYPQNLLQAALNNRINLPYSCRGGRCSACVVKCISGEVMMSINEVLTRQDLDEGYRLTCVGFAKTDLVLELE